MRNIIKDIICSKVECEPEEEEEGEDSNIKPFYRLETEVESEITRKTAKVVFASGKEETIEYHTFNQEYGIRKYKIMTDYDVGFQMIHFRKTALGFDYQYEQVKEVVMENVETVEVISEVTESFSEEFESEERIDFCSKRKSNAYERNGAETLLKEVNNGNSE